MSWNTSRISVDDRVPSVRVAGVSGEGASDRLRWLHPRVSGTRSTDGRTRRQDQDRDHQSYERPSEARPTDPARARSPHRAPPAEGASHYTYAHPTPL